MSQFGCCKFSGRIPSYLFPDCFRPSAAIELAAGMLRSQPALLTFAANAKSMVGRPKKLQTGDLDSASDFCRTDRDWPRMLASRLVRDQRSHTR